MKQNTDRELVLLAVVLSLIFVASLAGFAVFVTLLG